MDVHELCSLFPEMSKDEFASLTEDISKHGQLDPIVTHDDRIIDGRHRYRACCLLGKAPRFEEWNGQGGSLLAFVVSRNLHRRHLKLEDLVRLASQVRPMLEEEGRRRMVEAGKKAGNGRPAEKGCLLVDNPKDSPHDSLAEAAEMFGVSRASLANYEKVKKESPELLDAVHSGEISVTAAARELRGEGKLRNDTANPVYITAHHGQAKGLAKSVLRYFGADKGFIRALVDELSHWLGEAA